MRISDWSSDVCSSDLRSAFRMERFPHNTWRTGLDRILLGVAMSGDDHHHLGRGLPLDDVASSEIDLAGRLAELVRSEERRVGKECVSTCMSGGAPYPEKTNTNTTRKLQ